jgi:hypothetical protein
LGEGSIRRRIERVGEVRNEKNVGEDCVRVELKQMKIKETKGKATNGSLVVPQHLGIILCDDADVDVRTRSQIVEDTGRDGLRNHFDSLFSLRETQADSKVSFPPSRSKRDPVNRWSPGRCREYVC